MTDYDQADYNIEAPPQRRPRPFVPLVFPPQIRWGVRRGAYIAERPSGRNGKRLCGWCDSELPKYRRSWCSNECAEKFTRVWSWGALRVYIIGRDRICQRCGQDWPGWLRRQGRTICYLHRAPWQVDHIFPVKDGGTDDPENLRLLCNGCHIAVGYEQRAARAKPRDCRHEPTFPAAAIGVMCCLADPDLVMHGKDFRCPFESPHRWEHCGKVRDLPNLRHELGSNDAVDEPPQLQMRPTR